MTIPLTPSPILPTMHDYHNLAVWRAAHNLAVRVHALTSQIPRTNNAEIVGQIRRAALSIPANIAEGCGRPSDRDFAKFLHIAFASANELEYHLEFVADVGLLCSSRPEIEERRAEILHIRRMLAGLLRKVSPPLGE